MQRKGLIIGAMMIASFVFCAEQASAHGWVTSPPSRQDHCKNGRTSLFEVFTAASAAVKQHFEQRGQLLTEHAVIDDNGDGVGHEKIEAGEGLLARATYLDSLSVDEAAANVATAKLLKERTRLEGEIAGWNRRPGEAGACRGRRAWRRFRRSQPVLASMPTVAGHTSR